MGSARSLLEVLSRSFIIRISTSLSTQRLWCARCLRLWIWMLPHPRWARDFGRTCTLTYSLIFGTFCFCFCVTTLTNASCRRLVVSSPQTAVFFLTVFSMGLGNGLLSSYVALHIQSLFADPNDATTLLGLMNLVACSSEVVFFAVSSFVLEKIGPKKVRENQNRNRQPFVLTLFHAGNRIRSAMPRTSFRLLRLTHFALVRAPDWIDARNHLGVILGSIAKLRCLDRTKGHGGYFAGSRTENENPKQQQQQKKKKKKKKDECSHFLLGRVPCNLSSSGDSPVFMPLQGLLSGVYSGLGAGLGTGIGGIINKQFGATTLFWSISVWLVSASIIFSVSTWFLDRRDGLRAANSKKPESPHPYKKFDDEHHEHELHELEAHPVDEDVVELSQVDLEDSSNLT